MRDSSSNIIWAIIGIIVIVGIVVYAARARNNTAVNPTISPTTESGFVESPLPGGTESPTTGISAATISYGGNSFTPSSSAITTGSQVTFTNNSTKNVQVNSNPHPIHTDNPELNIGLIKSGESKTATLTKVGTFGFHNHLNPSEKAAITIQP